MDDKILEERFLVLYNKKLSDMSFLESLAYKSLYFLNRSPYEIYPPFIKLLIEAEEEELNLRRNRQLDIYFYEDFDKKLNAKIEEILNEKY